MSQYDYNYGQYYGQSQYYGDSMTPDARHQPEQATPQLMKPPEGWLETEQIMGDVIDNFFIPIKCPLTNRNYVLQREQDQFSLFSLCQQQWTQNNRKVTLVIDLNMSYKYYDANCKLTSTGEGDFPGFMAYFKLLVDRIEPRPFAMRRVLEQAQQFKEYVDRYRAEHPGEHCFVHCTHGINRTGLMIAIYLVQSGRCTMSQALAEFARARPPFGVYNPFYVCWLLIQFNDTDSQMFKDIEKIMLEEHGETWLRERMPSFVKQKEREKLVNQCKDILEQWRSTGRPPIENITLRKGILD